MGQAGVWYCTRESVKAPLSEQETARSNDAIDAAIEQGARDVEALCARDTFAPILATKRYDFPSRTGSPLTYRLWIDDLLSITTFTSEGGAVTLTPSQYTLEPNGSGPPYNRIELALGGTGSFDAGASWQQALAITGLWASARDTRKTIGTLAGSLAASTSATASMSWTTARFGVGDILIIDDERMIITERTFVDSGQNLAADLGSSEADTQVSAPDGTGYAVEEIISIGGERMRIVDITSNTLVVKRGWDGSQVAAHTSGADIYALTGVELDRAACGSTLAAHNSGATVQRWVPPGLVATLNRAYAINTLLGERSGWARTLSVNSDTAIELSGRGIAKLERDVLTAHGRRARTRAAR